MGLVDFTPVMQAPLLQVPEFAFMNYAPVINMDVLAIMVPVAIVTITEHIGDHLVLGSIIGRDLVKKELCEKNNVKLFYFSNVNINYPYDVYNDINKLIEDIYK